jgi:hypothetical protein
MNDKLAELAQEAEMSAQDGPAINVKLMMRNYAELLINEHLIIWEMMDNGNKVSGYLEMEDYPKAIRSYFGVSRNKRKNT